MEITLRERKMVGQFKCVDHYKKIKVGELAFKQGELFYFRNGAFDYIVLAYDAREDVYYR